MRFVKEGVSSQPKEAPSAPAKAEPPKPVEKKAPEKPAASADSIDEKAIQFDADGTKRVAMTKIRKKIAERLVKAQHTAAMLTTFNEIDMKALMDMRKKYRESFEAKHGVGLGMMSFFTRACVYALKECPRMNAFMDGEDIIYHHNINMGIAVSTDRGLVVPVLRNANKMSLAKIELEIRRLATAARDGKLGINDLSGGTFSITNGGVFGSLLSTPILNMPQTGILGMHTIQKRPVVIDDKIEIRPMMYVALTYDHRMIDGSEAVTFLVRVKQMVEDPARLLLEV
jgi:2-oxoglutarate dehydrogenase E2 component (dihydrolipoamide succinyltransferase)